MGVYYAISPINDEFMPVLNAMGVNSTEKVSRFPTLTEIFKVLDDLDGCTYEADKIEQGKNWDAIITCGQSKTPELWTRMTILEVAPSSSPQEFYFAKGAPELIFRILTSLADLCGPLVLLTEGNDMRAFVIEPNSDPSLLHAEWLGLE